jgi:hypothetical protein
LADRAARSIGDQRPPAKEREGADWLISVMPQPWVTSMP